METTDNFSVVSVVINDVPTRMVLDTGVGLTLIAKELCDQDHCQPEGQHTGRRMSGQSVSMPLVKVSSFSVGPYRANAIDAGILPDGMLGPGIGGILSLAFFEKTPITIDSSAHEFVFEDEASLERRAKVGTAIPVTIEQDGPSLTVALQMEIPGGPPATLEVDTGSNALILDERFMTRLGLDPMGDEVKRVEGKDETSNAFVRYFTTLDGSVSPVGAPNIAQKKPKVMFQRIIHEGLVGQSFLSRFAVTYDIPRKRMIFGKK